MAYLHATYATSDCSYGFEIPTPQDMPEVSRTFALTELDRDNVLDFLGRRNGGSSPIENLIHANGIVSPLNHGTFYAYHDRFGELEGVALIGVETYYETSSDEALAALSFTAAGAEGRYGIAEDSLPN